MMVVACVKTRIIRGVHACMHVLCMDAKLMFINLRGRNQGAKRVQPPSLLTGGLTPVIFLNCGNC